jgi:uncharacterized surface protein with fasciclin (FAS1) repeats
MKKIITLGIITSISLGVACNQGNSSTTTAESSTPQEETVGQSGVQDDVSNPNIVQVASGSKDHTTLVTAVKAAELVDALSNAGPFTVFAPTNAAFEKLPAGTVEGLLEPSKKDALTDILQYHVYVGVYKIENLETEQTLGQVNGGNIKLTRKGEDVFVNDNAKIVATVPTSNGVIYVIDQVLLPAQ